MTKTAPREQDERKATRKDEKLKAAKRLKGKSLGDLGRLIILSSAENNPDKKSFWRLYDELTLVWIAEELERRGDAEKNHTPERGETT